MTDPAITGRWAALVALADPEESMAVARDLVADGAAVLVAASRDEALARLHDARPDVAVADQDLPGGGLALVAGVRAAGPGDPWDPAMPVLVVSTDPAPHQAVRALDQGADDHLARPLYYPELLARLRLLVRRSRGLSGASAIRVGPLTVDRRARTATVDGQLLGLSAKELGLLTALARDPRRVLTKQELLRDVWGFRSPGRTRTVDSHASRLRRKLAALCPDQRFVVNVWGVGYRLLPDDA